MKHRGRMAQWGIAAVAAAVLVAPAAAHANVLKCEEKLETEVGVLQGKIFKALEKCKDAIRSEVSKGVLSGNGDDCAALPGAGCVPNAAKICEAALGPVYGAGGGSPDWGTKPAAAIAVKKFRSDIEKLRQGKCVSGGAACNSNFGCPAVPGKDACSATCNDEDLPATLTQNGGALGHLVSGLGVAGAQGFAPPKTGSCDSDADGHADPDCAIKYTTDFLLYATEQVTIREQLATVPDMLALFQDAVAAGPGPLSGSVASKKGTSCSSIFDANTQAYYPNLCHFGVQCHEHSCQIDTSGTCPTSGNSPCDAGDTSGTCNTAPFIGNPCHYDDPLACGTLPAHCAPTVCSGLCSPSNSYVSVNQPPPGLTLNVPLAGGLNIEVCSPGPGTGVCKTGGGSCTADADCTGANGPPCSLSPGAGEGFGFGAEPNFLYLINAPSKTVRAIIPHTFSALVAAACVGIVRSEGWCDCTGVGIKDDFTLCNDNILTLCAHHCSSAPETACTTSADCIAAVGSGTCNATRTCRDGSVPGCTADSQCVGSGGITIGANDSCNVPITASNSGDSTYGGSLDGGYLLTAGGGSTAGDCVDLVSASFSFMTDASQLGPDGLPCTADDFAAPSAPFALPLTTGTATAQLLDAPTAGGCHNSGHCSVTATQPCNTAANNCPGVETCNKDACAQDINCITGLPTDLCNNPFPAFSDLSVPVNGGKTLCKDYEASNLSGFAITGAVAANAGPPIGTVAVGFRFACK